MGVALRESGHKPQCLFDLGEQEFLSTVYMLYSGRLVHVDYFCLRMWGLWGGGVGTFALIAKMKARRVEDTGDCHGGDIELCCHSFGVEEWGDIFSRPCQG